MFRVSTNFFSSIKRFYSTNICDPLPLDSNITRIRIWKSGYFLENGAFRPTNVGYALLKSLGSSRTANIGHVSLETKFFHASLWPERLTIFNKLKTQDGSHSTIQIDEASEGRPPDHLVDFNTLNVESINIELAKFQSENKYNLIRSKTVFGTERTSNCSDLAYSLLIAGGIRKIVPPTLSIRDYFVVTPNNLAEMVLIAKKNEEDILSKQNDSQTPKR